jgi:hypothetical protein
MDGTSSAADDGTWEVAGRHFHSRLIVGTGRYKDLEETGWAIEGSGAEIVTVDSIVDEIVIRFTHTCGMDFLLPGAPLMGRRVEIPTFAVAQFQNGRLASKHIYWNHASVLAQIGRLNPACLPIAGVDRARKVLDRTLPGNRLMAREWRQSKGKRI